ncbi:MAG: YfhO family protein [Lachnospiraceae bacterium]|nr:YfhO family protein [Lachnospiraceae bacterium]
MHETKLNRKYVLIYTAVFAVLCLAVFLPFITGGRSLVGKGDGQSQYILQLRYMGQWLRQTLRDFLHGDFALRSYDFTIGMGEDIGSIVRFHPLDYLSVFVPSSGTEILYAFIIFLRLYLAGLAFSVLAFRFSCEGGAVLIGSIVYLFCGYVFELGIVHPIYISPMIVMPLLLVGAEYMMDRKRKHSFALLSIMVYLGFTSNYYFMYINSVALLIYVLIRFGAVYRENRVKNFFILFVRMVSAYLVGLMMAMITLLPTLKRYFDSYRSQSMAQNTNLLVYEDLRRYFAWFINLISPLEASGNGTHLNFAVIVLPCIVILVLSGKQKWKGMKSILLANLIFLLLPLGGYIMAVMHTENNRWVYLISLSAAMTVSFAVPEAGSLSSLQKKGLIAVTVLFDAGTAAMTALWGMNIYHLLAAAELTAATLLILGYGKSTSISGRKVSSRPASVRVMGMLLCVTVVSSVLNGYFTFGRPFGNLTRFYVPAGTTESYFSRSRYANYNRVGSGIGGEEEGASREWTDGFYRVDGYWRGSNEDNASIQLAYPGVQIYNSVLNASQIRYMMDTDNAGLTTMLHIQTLDGRAPSEAIAGVRYYQTLKKNLRQLPYGFDKQVWSGKKMAIYENKYPVNFGFTADTFISSSDYEKLGAAAKEEVMIHAAVVDDEAAGRTELAAELKQTDGRKETSSIESVELALPSGTEDIEPVEGGYRIRKDKSSVSFSFTRKAGCDTLLELEGLVPHDMGTSLRVDADGISRKVTLLSDQQTYTLLRRDYLVNLGYSEEEEEDTLTLTFRDAGEYDLEAVRMVYVPRADFGECTQELNRYSLQNVTFTKNTVTGSVSLDAPRFMVFQIPWNTGWSLQVNGEDRELIQTDRCYLGTLLKSGENEIRLTYRTPGSRTGTLLSLAGVLILVLALVLRRIRGWNNP